jgi:hypothetical protein
VKKSVVDNNQRESDQAYTAASSRFRYPACNKLKSEPLGIPASISSKTLAGNLHPQPDAAE